MPTISVIVPVYKVEPYLERCVTSILNQSFADFQLILVDDGSPDRCGEMCDRYAEQDSRIHVIHQQNGGLSAARNAGIDWVFANSDSQWFTFIDSDDWIHGDYLNAMYTAVEQYGSDHAICGYLSTESVCEDKLVISESISQMTSEEAYIAHYDYCMHAWGKLIHRSYMEKIRFPVGKLHEDAFVTHIFTFEAKNIVVCDFPLYYYFSNPGSITRVKWSEKRLHEFEGHELRLKYLQEHGYEKAFIHELQEYCRVLMAQAQDLRILSKQDLAYLNHKKAFRKKMMRVFREARKHGLYPYNEENVWIYELAYPVKPIWFLRNILLKLFKK